MVSFPIVYMEGSMGFLPTYKKMPPISKAVKSRADLERLVFLILLVIVFFIGLFYHLANNTPVAVLTSSVDRALRRPFRISLEGGVSINRRSLEAYRVHYYYQPGDSLAVEPPVISAMPPIDPVTALNLIRAVPNPREYIRQDMYSQPTRHLGGTWHDAADSSKVYIFNLWLNISSRDIVRLEISGVQRNVDVDRNGDPVSRETYLNMRYFDYGR